MSVEAYWFWLGISPDCKERECMRDLFGYQAKAKGTYLRETYPGEQIEDFQDRIIRAIWYKAKRHTDLFLPEYEESATETLLCQQKRISERCVWQILVDDRSRRENEEIHL